MIAGHLKLLHKNSAERPHNAQLKHEFTELYFSPDYNIKIKTEHNILHSRYAGTVLAISEEVGS
jgi:hypothetical protein